MTLIEVTVYLGLLSIILTGSISTAFYLSDGASKIKQKIAINEEKNFIFNIMEAALNHETHRLSLINNTVYLKIAAQPEIPLNLQTTAANLKTENLQPPGLEIGLTINDQVMSIKKYRK